MLSGEGDTAVAGEFSVSPDVLSGGSGELAPLRASIAQAGDDAVSALLGAAGSCGDGSVQAALDAFGKTAMQHFQGSVAGCDATSERLTQTAAQYRQAEAKLTRQAAGARP